MKMELDGWLCGAVACTRLASLAPIPGYRHALRISRTGTTYIGPDLAEGSKAEAARNCDHLEPLHQMPSDLEAEVEARRSNCGLASKLVIAAKRCSTMKQGGYAPLIHPSDIWLKMLPDLVN